MKKSNVIPLFGLGIIAIGAAGAALYTANNLSAGHEHNRAKSSIIQEFPADTTSVNTASVKGASTPAAQKVDSVEMMAERLRARLETEPNDMNGWVLLGRSYHFLQRWDDAKAAFSKARELGYQEPDVKLDSSLSAQRSMEADMSDTPRDEAASDSNEIFNDISHASSRLQQ